MDQEATQSSRPNSDESSSSPCPICLGTLLQESYLDQCFHKFCYNCIVQWTKVVATKHSHRPSSVKCPLCKTENFSIIHGYDGNFFQQHYVNQDFGDSFILSREHKCRLQCYYIEPGLLNDTFNVSRYWKCCKYLHPNRWVQTWLKRELQALMQTCQDKVHTDIGSVFDKTCGNYWSENSLLAEEDVDIIMHHIQGTIDSFLRRNEQKFQIKAPDTKREEFKALVSDAAKPFLAARTDRFVLEMELFLASGLNIEAYDKVYMQRLAWNPREDTASAVGEESGEHPPVIPYMHIFDDDSDETDH